MTPAIYEHILESLQQGSVLLDRVHSLAKEAGSTWSENQVHLFLVCMDGIEIRPGDEGLIVSRGRRTREDELASTIVEIVRSQAGQPIPAAAIRKRLPGQFVTTEEQIRALARRTLELEVVGPGLIRLKD